MSEITDKRLNKVRCTFQDVGQAQIKDDQRERNVGIYFGDGSKKLVLSDSH